MAAAATAPGIERGVFMDVRWAPHITQLRERWHAADQAHREVVRLVEYWTHWVADEPGDTVLWPRHTDRMSGVELTGRILAADQQLRDATTAGRTCGMQVARLIASKIAEVYAQSRTSRPSKTRIARAVVAYLTNRCRAQDWRVELFPPNLRPALDAT